MKKLKGLSATLMLVAGHYGVAQTINADSTATQTSHSQSNASSSNAGVGSSTNHIGPVSSSSQTSSSANSSGIGSGSSIGNTTINFGSTPPVQTMNQNVTGGTNNVNRNINEGVTTQHQVLSGGTTSSQNVNSNSRNENLNVTRMEGETTQRQVIEGEQVLRHEYSGTQTIKNVPSVNGPPLTTSNDTCMGSTSGSINGPGFGVGLGSTWTDRNCVMLKNARELWNMGMKAAAMALFCTDENNRSALEVTGFTCPQTALARQAGVGRLQAPVAGATAPAGPAEQERRRWLAASRPDQSTPLPPPVFPLAGEPAQAAAVPEPLVTQAVLPPAQDAEGNVSVRKVSTE